MRCGLARSGDEITSHAKQALQRGLSERSVIRYRASLSTFFAWCVREKAVVRNPVTATKVPRSSEEPTEMRPWTEAELEATYDRWKARDPHLADVLLVNPIRDGMNLVAKEGPVLSSRSALVLSREAGAAAELGPDALLVNPYDVCATAEALHQALVMPEQERLRRATRLRAAATALPPAAWFASQLTALTPPT